MKIGYPCINNSLECKSSKTFRLKNYSQERLKETIEGNLDCLLKILKFNLNEHLLFFRITSDLVPFASHPILDFKWQEHFKDTFKRIGGFIKENKMRITMHPGQYTVLNSKNATVFRNSVKELLYHIKILELMNLDYTAKVQIHVGGVYGNKASSLKRFIKRYNELDQNIRNRLVIENDDKSYSLKDCLEIFDSTKIPIVFDVYHHECNSNGETLIEAFTSFSKTWEKEDGLPFIHYSSEHPTKGKCKHADSIDTHHFRQFLSKTREFNFDIMLEIKDKEKSALIALKEVKEDSRFNKDY